ncbi:MAG: exodeoxyribonuclease VII small subunit [Helicobacteraceae bacterium]|nr:exodeoxyribonuclease VII small subunit [Helicobacteraceae bacterium]
MAKVNFEKKLDSAKEILTKLMDPDIALSSSVKAYEDGMKELNEAQKILEEATLQVQNAKSSKVNS